MQPADVNPESLLRAYQVLISWLVWALAAVSFLMVLLYLLLLSQEGLSFPRRRAPWFPKQLMTAFHPGLSVPGHLPSFQQNVEVVSTARPHESGQARLGAWP